jgi:hypothetical protein
LPAGSVVGSPVSPGELASVLISDDCSAFSGEHATSRRPSSSNDNTINLFFLILSPPIRFDLVSSGFIILVMTMNLAFLLPALDFSSGL